MKEMMNYLCQNEDLREWFCRAESSFDWMEAKSYEQLSTDDIVAGAWRILARYMRQSSQKYGGGPAGSAEDAHTTDLPSIDAVEEEAGAEGIEETNEPCDPEICFPRYCMRSLAPLSVSYENQCHTPLESESILEHSAETSLGASDNSEQDHFWDHDEDTEWHPSAEASYAPSEADPRPKPTIPSCEQDINADQRPTEDADDVPLVFNSGHVYLKTYVNDNALVIQGNVGTVNNTENINNTETTTNVEITTNMKTISYNIEIVSKPAQPPRNTKKPRASSSRTKSATASKQQASSTVRNSAEAELAEQIPTPDIEPQAATSISHDEEALSTDSQHNQPHNAVDATNLRPLRGQSLQNLFSAQTLPAVEDSSEASGAFSQARFSSARQSMRMSLR